MESVVRNVRDIDQEDRSALERVVGQHLRDNQRLIIQVADLDLSSATTDRGIRPPQSLDDWTSVYVGMSDEEIEALDAVVKTRANLTRNLP